MSCYAIFVLFLCLGFTILLPLCLALPTLSPFSVPHSPLALQLYQWATAVVASYSFVLGDDQFQAMVPVWDALNHVTAKVNVKLHHDANKGVLQVGASLLLSEQVTSGCSMLGMGLCTPAIHNTLADCRVRRGL